MTYSWLCDGCSAETLTATPARPPRCCACGRTGDVLVNVTPERIRRPKYYMLRDADTFAKGRA